MKQTEAPLPVPPYQEAYYKGYAEGFDDYEPFQGTEASRNGLWLTEKAPKGYWEGYKAGEEDAREEFKGKNYG